MEQTNAIHLKPKDIEDVSKYCNNDSKLENQVREMLLRNYYVVIEDGRITVICLPTYLEGEFK